MTHDFAAQQKAFEARRRRRGGVWFWLADHHGERFWLLLSWLFIIGVTAATIYAAYDSYRTVRGTFLIQARPEAPTANTRAFLIAGRDSWGRRALFDVVVSARSIRWTRGSTDTLEQDGVRIAEEALEAFVFEPDVQDRLRRSQALIAVGVASQEGDPDRERARADRRARQTARWLRELARFDGPIHTLNLGQYTAPCVACETDGTSWQRPLTVIAVRVTDPGVNLREALIDALERARNLPSPSSYSAFAFDPAAASSTVP